jgi:hypothetical protein
MRSKFWWFEGAPIRALRQQLADAGPAARLEVRLTRDGQMEFRVVAADDVSTQDDGGWTNESRVCPPVCP